MQAERKKTHRSQNEKDCGMRHCVPKMLPLRISTTSIQQSHLQLHALWNEHWRSSGRRSKRK